jgi:hypothetical protein
MNDEDMICIGCGKHPSQLSEYVEAAADEPEYFTDAADYVPIITTRLDSAMTALRNTGMTALRWGCLGIGFNIANRVMDYVIDSAVGHVTWLAWLSN